MLATGALRACWSLGLAFIGPGATGLAARHRRAARPGHLHGRVQPGVRQLPARANAADRVARTLSAWSVTSKLTIAAMTALWGLLASVTSLRTAIATAGVLMLTTPLLLLRHGYAGEHERTPALGHVRQP